jgi:hypothetical protein
MVILAAALVFTPMMAALPANRTLGGSPTAQRNLPVMQFIYDQSSSSTASSLIDTVKPLAKRPPPAPAANKWAVVIGIADYQGTGNDLWHPDEDANEMAKALVTNYGFASDHVRILLNRKATANAIAAAISWLVASEDSESTVVFFYSGHGSSISDNEGWDSDTESDGYDEMIVSYDLYGITDGYLK